MPRAIAGILVTHACIAVGRQVTRRLVSSAVGLLHPLQQRDHALPERLLGRCLGRLGVITGQQLPQFHANVLLRHMIAERLGVKKLLVGRHPRPKLPRAAVLQAPHAFVQHLLKRRLSDLLAAHAIRHCASARHAQEE
eukprot:284920-Chlamydomonas_euryale.AAC.2